MDVKSKMKCVSEENMKYLEVATNILAISEIGQEKLGSLAHLTSFAIWNWIIYLQTIVSR